MHDSTHAVKSSLFIYIVFPRLKNPGLFFLSIVGSAEVFLIADGYDPLLGVP